MKPRVPTGLFWMIILLVMAALACGINSTPPTPTSAPTSNSADSSNVAASVPTSAPVAVQQGVAPVSLPEKRSDQASDIDSSVDAAKKRVPGGDSFVNGLYERPFNANTMDTYLPYIDIVDTQGYKDDAWGYATITLSGADANGNLPGKYGVELDLNRDGRGDWLILASKPASTDWSTQGVQAWKDTNGDVGGIIPMVADKASTGDGYETLVFDQGKDSNNPDGAWVRVSPDDNKTVILAFKLSMLGNPKSYAMGAWAGTDLNPATFDLNDHMTHIQAGDPDPGLQLYAIKGLAEIDNTCRLAIGFASTGKEPGLCLTVIKHREQPGAPPPPPPGNNQPPGITIP
jgi:hypothetical protein